MRVVREQTDLERISKRIVQANFDMQKIRHLLGGGKRNWFSGETKDLAHRLLFSLEQDIRRLEAQKSEVKRMRIG